MTIKQQTLTGEEVVVKGSVASVWTFAITYQDEVFATNTYTIPQPTLRCAYRGTNRGYASFSASYCVKKDYNDSVPKADRWWYGRYGGTYTEQGQLLVELSSWASNATYESPQIDTNEYFVLNQGLVQSTPISQYSTSTLFDSTNKTDLSVQIYGMFEVDGTVTATANNSKGTLATQLGSGINPLGKGFPITVTLNVPPDVQLATPTYPVPYAGRGTYSVPIVTAEAYYGGDITKITLEVGADSTTQTYSTSTISNQTISVTPTIAGTYTPTLTVEDSRGQKSTWYLPQITVNPYNFPSVTFDVFRCDQDGIKTEEDTYGLIVATISYTDNGATLTQPTVTIDGTTTNNVTWYSAYNSSTGISSAISDWSTVSSGDTIYGLITDTFGIRQSYVIGVTETDSLGGTSQSVSQTLPTAYYTIDFQAGGKEISFGGPANDANVETNHPNGLFRCDMDAWFTGDVMGITGSLVGEIKAYAGVVAPAGWLECDGHEELIADYPALAAALGADDPGQVTPVWGTPSDTDHFVLPDLQGRVMVGQDANDTDFDTVGETGGAKTVTLQTTQIPSHSHGTVSGSNYAFFTGNAANITRTRFKSGSDGKYCFQGAQADMVNTANTKNTGSTGGGGAHTNVQPYAVVKYIICAA